MIITQRSCFWQVNLALFIGCVLTLAFGGCAQMGNLPAPGIHPGDAPITQREFVRADVQAALDIATAGGDKKGQVCLQSVLDVLPAGEAAQTQPTGLISIIESGRVARLRLQAGIPDSVASACGPLVLNSQAALFNAFLFIRP